MASGKTPPNPSLDNSIEDIFSRMHHQPEFLGTFITQLRIARQAYLAMLRNSSLSEEQIIQAGNGFLSAESMLQAYDSGRTPRDRITRLELFISVALEGRHRDPHSYVSLPDWKDISKYRGPDELAEYPPFQDEDARLFARRAYDHLRVELEGCEALRYFPDPRRGFTRRQFLKSILAGATGAAGGAALPVSEEAPGPTFQRIQHAAAGAIIAGVAASLHSIVKNDLASDRVELETVLERIFSATAHYCKEQTLQKAPDSGRS